MGTKKLPNASVQNVRGGLYPELGFMTLTMGSPGQTPRRYDEPEYVQKMCRSKRKYAKDATLSRML